MRDEDGALYAALRTHLHEAKLDRFADELLALARPAITLTLKRTKESNIVVGASKMGGAPDLPPDVEWPSGFGQPLPFVGQIRLEEVAQYDLEGELPHEGLLSFFYAVRDPDDNITGDDPTAWRVLYIVDTNQLVRRRVPQSLRDEDALDSYFPACAVTFGRRLTLPEERRGDVRAVDFSGQEELAYMDVLYAMREGVGGLPAYAHYLLGLSQPLEHEPEYEGYLRANQITPPYESDYRDHSQQAWARMTLRLAVKDWRPRNYGYELPENLRRALTPYVTPEQLAALEPAIQAYQPSGEERETERQRNDFQRQAEEEWRLLFQLYSNDEAEMDWEGGGLIFFTIARADLARRDFSRVWLTLDFL